MELDQSLVLEGQKLVGQIEQAERLTCEARFEIGRWALKAMPHQGNGGDRSLPEGSSPMDELLNGYAAAIGLAGPTLRAYRDVTFAWGDDDPAGLSWTVARKLAYRADRMDLIAAVFEMFGKITPTTLQNYEDALREENKRREQLLQPQFTDETEDDEFWTEEEEEIIVCAPPVTQPQSTGPTKHGFSSPIRKLFSVVEHVKAAKEIFEQESVPSVDIVNDENFEEIMAAFDTIITEIIDYREQLIAKRAKAGVV